MQIRKANYSKFSSFSFISFLLIFLFLFQACKKVDISESFASTTYNPTTNIEQTKSFFIIPANSPDALKIIAKEMQQQFKENDVQDFLNWHGLPLWSKVIKFEKDKNGSITYAIPTQKDGEVTGFFAATIDKSNKIKLEMHRESAVFAKMEEYSYANININKTKALLNYFSGITDVTAKAKKSETNNNLWDCLWYWVATTSLNLNNKKDSGTQNFRDGGYGNGYWLIVCMNIPDPPGGGGGTGGGSSGGSNNCDIYEEEFANNWWSNEPSSISACDLENMVNRLAGYLLLNAPQIEWLMGHPDRVLEIDRFIGDGNDSQKNQLARDHLEEMLVDIPYLTFVHNHGQTGDPYKMWWEDEPWLNNPNNFNLDITRASNQIYELNAAEKALVGQFPLQAYAISKNVPVAFAQSDIVYGGNTNPLNTKKDAFRHAFFNAINTRDAPPQIFPIPLPASTIVRLFSEAHETTTPTALNLEKQMDLFNNEVGINYCFNCYSTSNTSISNAILAKLLAGELRYLDPLDFILYPLYDADGNHIQDCATCTDGIYSATLLKPTNQ